MPSLRAPWRSPPTTTLTYVGADFTITQATPTLSVTNSPVVYNGLPQAAIVTPSVAGNVSNVRYNNSATVPTNAGTYAVTADFTPTDTTQLHQPHRRLCRQFRHHQGHANSFRDQLTGHVQWLAAGSGRHPFCGWQRQQCSL